jgi:hypothetical protein
MPARRVTRPRLRRERSCSCPPIARHRRAVATLLGRAGAPLIGLMILAASWGGCAAAEAPTPPDGPLVPPTPPATAAPPELPAATPRAGTP